MIIEVKGHSFDSEFFQFIGRILIRSVPFILSPVFESGQTTVGGVT